MARCEICDKETTFSMSVSHLTEEQINQLKLMFKQLELMLMELLKKLKFVLDA